MNSHTKKIRRLMGKDLGSNQLFRNRVLLIENDHYSRYRQRGRYEWQERDMQFSRKNQIEQYQDHEQYFPFI